MTCHNCLCPITEGEPYRKMNYWGGRMLFSKVIYVHYPRCPDGANPDAHYRQNVLEGKTEYRLIEEAKYIKEGI